MINRVLKTKDKIDIAINHYNNSHEEVVIVAPGWCMTKDSNAFCQISEMFAEHFDVITFDFRGHGKSGGMYTFMSKELIDMDCVVRFARKNNYKKIYLAGFSLGGAMVLIYASKSRFINKVIAVSAPADFDKIENDLMLRSRRSGDYLVVDSRYSRKSIKDYFKYTLCTNMVIFLCAYQIYEFRPGIHIIIRFKPPF